MEQRLIAGFGGPGKQPELRQQRRGVVVLAPVDEQPAAGAHDDAEPDRDRPASGCSQAPPTVAVGGAPFGITIDPARNDVYVNSLADADVAVIDGNACNATNTKGCQPDTIPVRMGGFGGSIAIDQAAHTAYVPNNDDANVSFFRLGH